MDSKKVIWLVCNNVQPPEIDTHLRHQKFAKYLKEDGYEVYIIGASFLHYSRKDLIEGMEKFIIKNYSGLDYIFIKVPPYTKNTSIKRFYSNYQFAWRLFRLKKELPKPNIILHNTRIPCDVPIYWAAKSLKADYITETWDLWPRGFATAGLFKDNSLIMKIFYRIEYFIYAQADRNIFTFEGGKQYIIDHKWDQDHGGKINLNHVYYINNGIDLNDFDLFKNKFKIENPELEDKSKTKILYLGSVSYANGVDEIIETAKLLKDKSNILFLIFGDGTERELLEQKVRDEKINNVKFLNKWVEIKYVPYILSCADINLLNYNHTSEKMIYGGSQGKLFQYLAAGKPILSNCITGYDIVRRYGAGISEDIISPQQYKEYLCSMIEDKVAYRQMSEAAREAAKDFDFRYLYKKFKAVLDDIS